MINIAVFPGSFDPITIGHQDIVHRALPLFDSVIIAIGENAAKQYMYPLQKRKEWITSIFSSEDKIRVESYEGLTVNFCKEAGAAYIIRGLRSAADFEYEQKTLAADRRRWLWLW